MTRTCKSAAIALLAASLIFNALIFAVAAEDSPSIEKPPSVVTWLKERGLGPEGVVLVLGMMPVFELRGALPVALLYYKMPLVKAYLLSVLGNVIPIIPIILLIGPVSRFLTSRSRTWKRFFDWVFERSRRRGGDLVEKYEALGLALFVAIPLPMTGAWTGAFLAFLLSIKARRAFPAILGGVLVAGVVVAAISLFGRGTFRLFIQ